MNKVLGIIFSNMHEHLVGELATHRCMGSIPVGGRYRLIDFALSNFTNSGVESVGVITKSNYQSLMDHLGNGREWDLSRKNGGLVILPPFGRAETGMYRGRIDALAGVMNFIKASGAEYVITADCDMLANYDLRAFYKAHRESGADVTVMYGRLNMQQGSKRDQCVLDIGKDGFATEMLINPNVAGIQNIYLNVMVMRTEYLTSMVDEYISRGQYSYDKEALQQKILEGKVFTWELDSYVGRFDSMLTFFKANLALLDSSVRQSLFPPERPVYTKVRDEAPVRYGLDAKVSGSLIADGCLIEGEVENSVLFRGVTVGKGAKIKNSVLMQGTTVGANSSLEYVITDKNVVVKEGRMLMGFETYPVYIAKGSLV